MPRFIINKNAQPNGDNEVHEVLSGCPTMPNSENQQDLGYHFSCREAIITAKQRFPQYRRIDGCYHCCNDCHNS